MAPTSRAAYYLLLGRILGLVVLHQDFRRPRAHHPVIRHLALIQQLAHLCPANRHRRLALIGLHQPHTPQLLKVRRKAHIHRLDLQIAAQTLKHRLRVKVAPNRRPVVVGRVGVLAANDKVRQAQVLPVNGVHHRLGRPAIVHAHVQPSQVRLRRQVLPLGRPQLAVLIALAQVLFVNQLDVRLHASFRRHVVALELADQRVEEYPRLFPRLAENGLRAVHQCVLVRAVQRVARLERHRLLVALLREQSAHGGGRVDAVDKRACVGKGEEFNGPADECGAVVGGPEACARVVFAIGEVDGGEEGLLVPGVDGGDVDCAKDSAGGVDEGAFGAVGGGFGLVGSDGEDDGDGPGPVFAVARDALGGEDGIVVGLGHGAGERGESSVGDAVEGGEIDLGDGDLGEEFGGRQRFDDERDGLGQPAVDG
mmetsp:Transcript_39086/g.95588  ORF Transcript_39086/g.95588 Transcript_39086/m.95588 type:complete len:424 (+) Transcript_39086:755-2026(+)